MPVSIRIEPKTGVAIATCSGVLRLNDARQGAAALWKTPRWPGKAAVWDFRAAEYDVSTSDVREMASFILHHQPSPPPSRIAFVTPREADFGMARMFGTFREEAATAFRVFRDYDEAMDWARSPEAG